MRALAAGKHVFIEKPLAASAADARELVAAAEAGDRRLMVGHLLLFHPALAAVRELIDSGELGEIYYLYGNRVNLGQVRADENALWSLGVHDVAVLLDLVGERPVEAQARGECYVRPERRGRRLRLPQVPVRHGRAPPPELARPAQDAQADGRRVAEDGRVRRHGDRPQGHDLRQERLAPPSTDSYGEYVSVRFGDISIPRIANDEPLRLECQEFVDAIREARQPRCSGREGLAVVEVLEAMQTSLDDGGARREAGRVTLGSIRAARTCTSATT